MNAERLPILIEKAVRDAGMDLIESSAGGGFHARVSGSHACAWIRVDEGGIWVALPVADGGRLGLMDIGARSLPPGMSTIGRVASARSLYLTLHAACVLQLNTTTQLSARVEERLAAIAETERTAEVRQRIGQDVFREALFELWVGCCAVTGAKLPPALLRASHAKPWADASDDERLDPFNGLLLAVHLDALFDAGLVAFSDDGAVLVSPDLSADTRHTFGLLPGMRLQSMSPGHLPYLQYHRRRVAHFDTRD
ncbi:MAG: HNH endonuclease signature motif containing protein [Comamonas sp.]